MGSNLNQFLGIDIHNMHGVAVVVNPGAMRDLSYASLLGKADAPQEPSITVFTVGEGDAKRLVTFAEILAALPTTDKAPSQRSESPDGTR